MSTTYDLYDILGNFLGSIIADSFRIEPSRYIDDNHLVFYVDGVPNAIFVESMVGINKIVHLDENGATIINTL